MKKFWAGMMLFCFMLNCGAVSEAQEKIYLALGDSLTTGYGLKFGEKGFPDIIAENHGYTLVNKAVNGSTVDGLIQVVGNKNLLPTIEKAELITVSCGGNDLMGLLMVRIAEVYNAYFAEDGRKLSPGDIMDVLSNPMDPRSMKAAACTEIVFMGNGEWGIEPFLESEGTRMAMKQYTEKLNGVIGKIRSMNPNAVIIVSTQYNPYKGIGGELEKLDVFAGLGTKMLSDVIRENANEGGYSVADVYEAFESAEGDLLNASLAPVNLDVHPNAEGHKLIAACFENVINGLAD